MISLRSMAAAVGWRGWAMAALLACAAVAPFWGPPVLAHLSYFRVRRVEVIGARYIPRREILDRLALDSGASVWDDYADAARRVATHPLVEDARMGRRLPATLVVRVQEHVPVALVAADSGVQAVDARGRILPIDLLRVNVDLPVVAQRDVSVLAMLDSVRARRPGLFDRISDVQRTADGELILHVDDVTVRARRGVSAARLADIIPVERDLERRNARVAELDLRFRDQVIARLQ